MPVYIWRSQWEKYNKLNCLVLFPCDRAEGGHRGEETAPEKRNLLCLMKSIGGRAKKVRDESATEGRITATAAK